MNIYVYIYMHISTSMCVDTTSLIRKIDRALFTFWLYIICRRRCVILIFIFFLSRWCGLLFACCFCCCYFSLHWYVYISLVLVFNLLSLFNGVWYSVSHYSVYMRLCDQNALFSFVMWCYTYFIFCCFRLLSSRETWFFDYYIIVDTDMGLKMSKFVVCVWELFILYVRYTVAFWSEKLWFR